MTIWNSDRKFDDLVTDDKGFVDRLVAGLTYLVIARHVLVETNCQQDGFVVVRVVKTINDVNEIYSHTSLNTQKIGFFWKKDAAQAYAQCFSD